MSNPDDFIPFDHHCPEAGSGLNFHKVRCDARQEDKTQRFCYGGCKSGSGRRDSNVNDDDYWTGDRGKILDMLKSNHSYSAITAAIGADKTKIYRTKQNAIKSGRLSKEE